MTAYTTEPITDCVSAVVVTAVDAERKTGGRVRVCRKVLR